ncbi:MAG TPA: hypothetical protein VGF55_27315 [Gemmataceae bacterium]|jgi:hypothetical protein
MTHPYCGCALALLVAAIAAADDKPAPKAPGPVRPNLSGMPKLDDTSRYLARVVWLRGMMKAPGGAMLNQALAAEESFVGRDREAMALMDIGRPEIPAAKNTDALDPYEPRDAADAILALADKHQVVMINEAHHAPRHRAFAARLLEGLRKKGFTYFAAETFGSGFGPGRDDMTPLAKRGYPTLDTGYYTAEPAFGELVRTACRLGFTPVAYEHRWATPPTPPTTDEGRMKQVAEREEGEAKNLIDRIFKNDPKAKVVVHAGYYHVRKAPASEQNPIEWMAARFKKATGIDPLTVDQAEVMEHSKREFEHPAYRLAYDKKKVSDRPWVLFDAKAEKYYVPPRDRGAFDVTVFHPRDEYDRGRPTWLRTIADRKAVAVPGLPAAPAGGSLLVQAFRKGEDVNVAIPVDQVEYAAADPAPVLMLPAGEHVVRVVDAAGKVVYETAAAG